MLTLGAGLGPQWVTAQEEVNNIRLKNKYQIGGELELSTDFLRKRHPPKFSFIVNYGVYYTHERMTFETYFDSSMSKDFSHQVILKRITPTFSLKLKWNTVKCRPYLLIGTYAKRIVIQKHITVSKDGQLIFSSANFDATPTKTLIATTLLYAFPGTSLLVTSAPYCEIGLCIPRYPNINISAGIIIWDSLNIFDANQKNYIQFVAYPQGFERIILMRNSILFKLKMRII